MANFLQLVIAGLATGAIYALVAIGFTLLWQTSQTINFAQGEFVMLPAFFVLIAMSFFGLSFWPAVAVGGVVSVIVLGLLFKKWMVDPMIRHGVLPLVIDDQSAGFVALSATNLEPCAAIAHHLAAALRSLLLNVRQHAQAGRVVLHAAEDEDGTGWEVTLHDDGIGFDTSATAFGVGLREVVVEQLARSEVSVEISSIRDLGTTVTLTQTTLAEVR